MAPLARRSAANGSQPSPRWRLASHKTSCSVACHRAALSASCPAASRSISLCSLSSPATSCRETVPPDSRRSKARRKARLARSAMPGTGRPAGRGGRGGIYPGRGGPAGSGRGVLQQPPPFRADNGQHGPDGAAARHRIVAVLDLTAADACPGVDRAHALRQGKPLCSAPRSREIITIRHGHGSFHDASHSRHDGAAGDAQDLALPDSGSSAHNPSRATHSALSVARLSGIGRPQGCPSPDGERSSDGGACRCPR